MSNTRNGNPSTPRRPGRRLVAGTAATAVAAALVLTACSADRVGAPDLAATRPSLAKGGSPGSAKIGRPAKSARPAESLTFVYNPAKKTVQNFGTTDQIVIPAGAVCDPATSGYGVGLWDRPCTPLKEPLTFRLTWTVDVYGHTVVEFSPDVRFVPGSQVVLDITDRVKPKDREKGTIYWCPTGSAECVDESVDDASVQTTARGSSLHLVRLLKHFSGYNVVFGLDGGSGERQ
jgi:hypothetical protein